jgi:hypothetical protein
MSLYSRAETNAQSLTVLNTTEKNSVDKYDWDNTLIVDGDSTVAGAQGYTTAARRTIFIDAVEATLSENRERGLTAPGWWEYMTYTDADGKTRHKAQHLVAFASAPANTADLDDAVAADVASAITISGQPANRTGVATPYTNTTAFTVTASATTGTLTYQWQYQTAAGTVWRNCTSAVFTTPTATSLGLSAAAKATYDGYKFRVKITSSAGAEEVISNTATLTYA